MPKRLILILAIIFSYIFGILPGYLLGRTVEDERTITLQQDHIKLHRECDSVKKRLHIYEVDYEKKVAVFEHYINNSTFTQMEELEDSLTP